MDKITKTIYTFSVRDGSDKYALQEVIDMDSCGMKTYPKKLPAILVDIGAHIGGFSIYNSSKFFKIYAVEPNLNSFEILLNNIEENNIANIHPIKTLISNTSGERTLFLGSSSVRNSLLDSPLCKKQSAVVLPSLTLPDFLEKYNITNPYFLKIDIEGGEWEILLNLNTNYFKQIFGIVMETHESLNTFGNTVKLIEILRNNGFNTKWKKEWFIDNTLAGILQAWKE